jgi:hypothetical protein
MRCLVRKHVPTTIHVRLGDTLFAIAHNVMIKTGVKRQEIEDYLAYQIREALIEFVKEKIKRKETNHSIQIEGTTEMGSHSISQESRVSHEGIRQSQQRQEATG